MSDLPQFKVDALSLNLRTEPVVTPGNRLALLPRGHLVTGVGSAPDEAWLMVSARLNGHTLTGFAARRFLEPVSEVDPTEHTTGITEVHFREHDRAARRDVAGKRAMPIGEADPPNRRVAGTLAEKVDDLTLIGDWLDVERSERYQPTATDTYCNIYAHDYSYLAGAYLPRVWWTARAAADLKNGISVAPAYDKTIHELNANSLFDWLVEFGAEMGWERVVDLDVLQSAANEGCVGIICAQRVDQARSGHIAVVVPERDAHQAVRVNGEVTQPLQSQAGATNLRYSTRRWWTDSKFREFGFWVHP